MFPSSGFLLLMLLFCFVLFFQGGVALAVLELLL